MQTGTFEDNIAVLQAEVERITQYLANLTPEAWNRASACDAWQVQDVVAHLIGVAEFYADNISRGLQGDTGPQPGRPPAGTITAAVAAEAVAKRAILERELAGDQLLDKFRAANAHLGQRLVGLRPEERTTPCYHPGGVTQAQQFVDLRLKELAVHEWDIRSLHEPEIQLAPAGLPAILRLIDGSIASGSLPWGFRAGAPLATPLRYRFEVSGPVPYAANLVVAGDAVQQETGGAPADVTFRCDTETFVLLVYGRLPLEKALQDRRLTADGDRDLALTFTQWFKGI